MDAGIYNGGAQRSPRIPEQFSSRPRSRGRAQWPEPNRGLEQWWAQIGRGEMPYVSRDTGMYRQPGTVMRSPAWIGSSYIDFEGHVGKSADSGLKPLLGREQCDRSGAFMSSVPRKRRGVSDSSCFRLLTNTSGRTLARLRREYQLRVSSLERGEGMLLVQDGKCVWQQGEDDGF